MAISIPLLAKGAAGLAAIGTPLATAIYYRNEIKNIFTSSNESGGNTNLLITKWDEYIKTALKNTSNSDFKFSLLDDVGSTDLSTFPQFKESSGEKKATIIIKIEAGEQKTEGENTLKSKNNNTNWTWQCTIEFAKKTGVSEESLKEEDKKAIYNSDSEGFLSKLKQTSNGTDEKTKIIDLCAKARGNEKNKELQSLDNLNNKSNEITSSKKFDMVKDESSNNLKFSNEQEFKEWFKTSESSPSSES